jgi:signal transduction histidine kinase
VSVPINPELLRAKVRVFAELYRKKRELAAVFDQVRRFPSRMIELQDEERRKIARELHDSLGQQLSLAKIIADGIKDLEAIPQAREISALIDTA